MFSFYQKQRIRQNYSHYDTVSVYIGHTKHTVMQSQKQRHIVMPDTKMTAQIGTCNSLNQKQAADQEERINTKWPSKANYLEKYLSTEKSFVLSSLHGSWLQYLFLRVSEESNLLHTQMTM